MAVIEWTRSEKVGGKLVINWANLAANDDGAAIIPESARPLACCAQFYGTFGGTVNLKHSNDGITWYVITDLDGVAISPTAPGLVQFSSAARYIRPEAEAGVVAASVMLVLRG